MIICVSLNPYQNADFDLSTSRKQFDCFGSSVNVAYILSTYKSVCMAIGFVQESCADSLGKCLDKLNIKHDFVTLGVESKCSNNMQRLYLCVESHLKANDILLLSGVDCTCQSGSCDIYARLTNLAHEKQAFVLMDGGSSNLFHKGVEAKPDWIKPNRNEVCDFFQAPHNISNEKLISYSKRFLNMGIKLVIVSLGDQGALFVDVENVILAAPVDVKRVSNLGAGDGMLAALALAKQEGYDDAHMAQFACASGSLQLINECIKCPDKKLVDKKMKEVMIRAHV